jgi:hypothetical protein
MEFTLQLEAALAEELRRQASDEHTSVEELAQRLMRDAIQERSAAKRWRAQNRRRLELIAKKLNGPLAPEEAEEFDRLQALAGERATPVDKILLQTTADLRHELEQLHGPAVKGPGGRTAATERAAGLPTRRESGDPHHRMTTDDGGCPDDAEQRRPHGQLRGRPS